MKLRVFTPDGSSCTERDFPIAEFEGDNGSRALNQVLLAYMANRRMGTVNTLTNQFVHGTGKKPFKQKGSGVARQGARNRPQHYHGSKSHGPHPRDYTQRISKTVKKLALGRAFFERAAIGEVDVIERFELPEAKTKAMSALMARIDPKSRKILIVDAAWSDTTILASRNLARIYMVQASDINALDFSNYDRIVVSAQGMDTILARLGQEKEAVNA
ncbi:MAG TPA: 50S ribosomal protein L4 [Opitutales bacterium]|nr:50S ribosomal protein L4 [Opitutales bacterium]